MTNLEQIDVNKMKLDYIISVIPFSHDTKPYLDLLKPE
jgi:hypothetical protein